MGIKKQFFILMFLLLTTIVLGGEGLDFSKKTVTVQAPISTKFLESY